VVAALLAGHAHERGKLEHDSGSFELTKLRSTSRRRTSKVSDCFTCIFVPFAQLKQLCNFFPLPVVSERQRNAGRAICRASVCPSVCDTRVDQSKTVAVRIMQLSPQVAQSL